MRLTWLSPRPFWPPHGGGRLRTMNLVKRMLEAGHEVNSCYLDDGHDVPHEPPWEGITYKPFEGRARVGLLAKAQSILSVYPEPQWVAHSRPLQFHVASLSPSDTDLVVLEQAHMGPYRQFLDSRIPILLDTQNLESEIMHEIAQEAGSSKTRTRLHIEASKMAIQERKLFTQVDRIVAVSNLDRDRINGTSQRCSPIDVCENGVDLNQFSWVDHSEVNARPRLILTGTLGYPPNISACIWLLDEIFPALLNRHPGAVLQIVGTGAPEQLRGLAATSEGVEFVGEVADVRPFLAHADVAVIPLRSGGGTRLKALEAAAAGLPIVSTAIGIEGLGLVERGLALVADDTHSFAEKVSTAITATTFRNKTTLEAREYVAANFSWDVIASKFLASLERTVG